MALTTYTYSIANDTLQGVVNESLLRTEIESEETFVVQIDDVGSSGDVLNIVFRDPLTAGDQTTLDGIVAAHNGFLKVQEVSQVQVVNDGSAANIFGVDDRIKIDVIGTLGDGQVKVSDNDASTSFLENKIVAENNKVNIQTINDGAEEDVQIGIVPGNIGTSELNNDANFIDSAGAPVQPSDIANFETSTQLDARDVANRDRANHTGTQLSSTISDFTSAVQAAETVTNLSFNNTTKVLTFTNEAGTNQSVDLTQFLDDTNLARITSGSLNAGTGIATFTRDDLSTFTVDFSSLNDQSFINSAIATHEASITNHDDVNTAGVASGDILEYNGANWVPGKKKFTDFTTRTTGEINQNTTFSEYLKLSTVLPTTGNYKISWSYTWSVNSTGNDFIGQVVVDNSNVIMEHRQEPKDASGAGVSLPNTDGGTSSNSTNQRYQCSGFFVLNLAAGAHEIDLDYRGGIENIEPAIYRACLTVEEL